MCGEYKYSGQSFEHRRQWMIERIRFLTNIFAIDICSYAIMSNHYHLVLHIKEQEIDAYSEQDICDNWCRLYSCPVLVSRWQLGELTSEGELNAALEILAEWRRRLADISWFMRCLNVFIARKYNKEDNSPLKTVLPVYGLCCISCFHFYTVGKHCYQKLVFDK